MEQREYWDSVSGTKEFTTPFQADAFSRYVKKDGLVADIGCGYGRTMDELRGLGYTRLVGFDFSPEMTERGKRQFPGLDLRVKENDAVDLPDSCADAPVLIAVLTCIVRDEEQKRLVAEIRRILKPGGILYVNDFLLNTDERNLERYERYRDVFGVYGAFELPEGAVCRHHSEEWIRELLGAFRMKESERLVFTTMNGHRSNGFYYIGEK